MQKAGRELFGTSARNAVLPCIGYHTHQCAYAPSGRQGLAIVAHKLAGDSPVNNDYIKLASLGLQNSIKHLNDAHADSVLGVCWGLIGANVSSDRQARRGMMDYNKAPHSMLGH